jgi:hypothetical protein
MAQSIKQRINATSAVSDRRELKFLFDAIKTDLAAALTDITALATALDTLAAKLNADTGVNDTDYDETNAAGVTMTGVLSD